MKRISLAHVLWWTVCGLIFLLSLLVLWREPNLSLRAIVYDSDVGALVAGLILYNGAWFILARGMTRRENRES